SRDWSPDVCSSDLVDDILSAWAGGAPAPAPSAAPAPADTADESPAAEPAAAPEPAAPEPVAIPAFEQAAVAVMEVVEEEKPKLDPVPMAKRVGTAVRVGSWVGAALGVVGFLVASMTWAPAAIIPEEGAAVAVA